MTFVLAPLPYDYADLEPHMSGQTLRFHHNAHHAAYVKNLNASIQGNPLENASLEDIIFRTHEDPEQVAVFNNAAQVWNHDFFWNSLRPSGGGEPTGELAELIDDSFGSFAAFQEEFETRATKQFGSGWAWLVLAGDKLVITTTGNADTPLVHGQTALLTCDVWEHAYYLDHQNRRPAYVKTFLDKLANWEFATTRLENARHSLSRAA